MTAVGSAVKFLVETFELQHLNVTGPASENEYIFVPDPEPKEPEPEPDLTDTQTPEEVSCDS